MIMNTVIGVIHLVWNVTVRLSFNVFHVMKTIISTETHVMRIFVLDQPMLWIMMIEYVNIVNMDVKYVLLPITVQFVQEDSIFIKGGVT